MTSALTPEELRRLAGDVEFQKIIASDPELDRLEALQYNPEDEADALYETIFRSCGDKRGKIRIRPLTPCVWAMLWLCGSPYVGGGLVHETDMDLFLFLLTLDFREKNAWGPAQWRKKADGIRRRIGFSPEEAHRFLRKRIRIAFLPLKLLPRLPREEEKTPARFDAEWLNFVCANASVRTMTPIRDVMLFMSLNQVCWQYVNRLRERLGPQNVRRRPDSELAREMLVRVYELGKKFLRQE